VNIDFRTWDNLFSALNTKQDTAMNLYWLKEYVLMNTRTGKPAKGVTNITMNDPMIFGDTYMALMAADKRKIEVTAIDEVYQHKVEEDFKLWFDLADERNEAKQYGPLGACMDFEAGFRGAICSLPLVNQDTKDKEKYFIDIMPTSARWTRWEIGERGVKRFAYIVRMDKAEAEETFKKTIKANSKQVNLYIYWDDKIYGVYNGQLNTVGGTGDPLQETPHELGFCPAVVTRVTKLAKTMSGGGDPSLDIAQSYPNIFDSVVNLAPAINHAMSTWASLADRQFFAPMVIKTDAGINLAIGDPDEYFGNSFLLPMGKEDKLENVPTPEVTAAQQAIYQQIVVHWQKATFPDTSYGSTPDRMSASLYFGIEDNVQKILDPNKNAKNRHFRGIMRSIQRQLAGKCYQTTVADEDAIEIKNRDLYKEKFSVVVSHSSTSSQKQLALAQQARMYKELGYPDEYLMTNVMREDDPANLLRVAKKERLYKMIPAVEVYDAMMADKDDLTEKQKNYGRDLIIKTALEKQFDLDQGSLNPVPNPASQPAGSGRQAAAGGGSIDQQAAAQRAATGQQGLTTQARPNNLGKGGK
jgi:hypothetical protein